MVENGNGNFCELDTESDRMASIRDEGDGIVSGLVQPMEVSNAKISG